MYSGSWELHKQHLQEVFDRLMAADLRLHPGKCAFAKSECVYLGHRIGRKGVAPDVTKIKADQ